MQRDARLSTLYLLNCALLFTHEIDSAYWQEWDLFGLPGGIQGFLAANFALLVVALLGFWRLLDGARSGAWLSLVLAAGGVFAFAIHMTFILRGRTEFTLPASLIVLGLTLAVSLAQGWLTIAALRRPG